jgi:hypothetical protein
VSSGASRPAGLFVPKPSRGAGCQGCGLPGLGSIVRRCPLASAAVGGDCYSLGYSVARESVALIRPRGRTNSFDNHWTSVIERNKAASASVRS